MSTSSRRSPDPSLHIELSLSLHMGPTLTGQHDIVLDYIHTQAYASTARVLARPRPWGRSSVRSGAKEREGEATMAVGGASNGDGVGVGGGDGDGDGDVEMAGEGTGDEAMDGHEKEESGPGYAGLLTEENLVSMERRRAILNYILNGAIMRAVESLNTHFPLVLAEPSTASYPGSMPINGHSGRHDGNNGNSNGNGYTANNNHHGTSHSPSSSSSLPASSSTSHAARRSSNGTGLHFPLPPSHTATTPLDPPHSLPTLVTSSHPAHIRLNLQIQSFIESFRQLAPSASAPPSPESSIGSLSSSTHLHLPAGSGASLTSALTAAQGLHQEAKKLLPEDRAVYLQEIKDVGALFAYSDPESSILRGFLDQGRRIALAEQVNRAILLSQNHAPKSQLEHCARRVTALWTTMSENYIDPIPQWSASDGPGKEDLALYIKSRPKGVFSLKDFVAHSTT